MTHLALLELEQQGVVRKGLQQRRLGRPQMKGLQGWLGWASCLRGGVAVGGGGSWAITQCHVDLALVRHRRAGAVPFSCNMVERREGTGEMFSVVSSALLF